MEEWKNIDGFPGYQVSTLGNVRSRRKRTKHREERYFYDEWHPGVIGVYVKGQEGYVPCPVLPLDFDGGIVVTDDGFMSISEFKERMRIENGFI